MNYKPRSTDLKITTTNILGWFFGTVVFAAGIINTFWGNDREFGIMNMLLAFVFLPPINSAVRRWTRFEIPLIVKLLLAVFVIIALLGVGEIFAKIDLMLADLGK